MMCGYPGAYDCIKAFSETDFTEDLKKFDVPTLILHGDSDKLVPIQQSETFVEKLKGAGVDTKLIVRQGAGHGWPTLGQDMNLIADWFDAHLTGGGEGK